MRKLLWIVLGLGLVAIALFALARTESGGHAANVPSLEGPPLDEIDAASRRQLERALIEAERREDASR